MHKISDFGGICSDFMDMLRRLISCRIIIIIIIIWGHVYCRKNLTTIGYTAAEISVPRHKKSYSRR